MLVLNHKFAIYPYNKIKKFNPIASSFSHWKWKEKKGAGTWWAREVNKVQEAMISFGFTFPREGAERRVKVGGIANDREEVGLVVMLRRQEELSIFQASMFIFKAVGKWKNLTLFLYCPFPTSVLLLV